MGPHTLARNWRSRGVAQTLETGKHDGDDSHVCLPASPMEGLPPSHRSLSFSICPSGKPRLRDARTWVRSPRPWRKSQLVNPASGKKLGPFSLAWCQSDSHGGTGHKK